MAGGSGSPRELRYGEVESVLRLAAREPPGLTLIGGQALNFWADRYLDVSPLLQQEAPFTSSDIDFVGPLAAKGPRAGRDQIDVAGELAVAQKVARALHGQFEKRGVYGSRVTLAAITYRDEENETRVIHFLGRWPALSRWMWRAPQSFWKGTCG